jgi:4-hydroxybenzoate polyprenyltransferase
MGILGIFGSIALMLSPWALPIIGFIFFISGISLIKRRKDTEDIEAEKKLKQDFYKTKRCPLQGTFFYEQ